MVPYDPIRVEFGIPTYSSSDIEMFGLPDHYGVWQYMVVETRETSWPLVHEWTPPENVKKHKYDRIERFETIVRYLCGGGKIPLEVYEWFEENMFDHNPTTMFATCQKLLRKKKWGRYTNRIPLIIEGFGYSRVVVRPRVGGVIVSNVFEKFRMMSVKFDGMPKTKEWKYFPNMRYVALRLMQMNGVTFNYTLPLVKTPSKVAVLENKFDILFN
tara:strand:- start:112 stop:753 length:642 start_codon:yes stop_codon:yes gene_type:complete